MSKSRSPSRARRGRVAELATGWFHPIPKGDPLNKGDHDDYEFHDITNCPTQPCPKCIPASIVCRDASAAPAVVVDEAIVERAAKWLCRHDVEPSKNLDEVLRHMTKWERYKTEARMFLAAALKGDDHV